MKFKYNAFILVLILFCCLFPQMSYSWLVESHDYINKTIADRQYNGFSLDSYMKYRIGFDKGKFELFLGQIAQSWLGVGGKEEDEPTWCVPYARSFNHFHNPLTDNGYSQNESAILWAQSPIGTQYCGDYSWMDTRSYFFKALTTIESARREKYFADSFQGIGRLMHLVSDMGVPEHTRNQVHLFGGIEGWLNAEVGKTIHPVYDNAFAHPFFPADNLLFTASAFPSAPVPIANLFDANRYNGTNPDITIGNDVGLSEYSNANFLSEGIMFTGFSGEFPFPAQENTVFYKDPVNNSMYISKIGAGDNIVHFAATNCLYNKFPSSLKKYGLKFDSKVYSDYTAKLLPRAIGYSGTLMKYFFRGTLEIAPPPEYVYSVIDGSDNTTQFTKIKVKLRNSTIYDNIVNGKFTAVAKYKKRKIGEYRSDLSLDPPAITSREPQFSYSVSADNAYAGTLPSGTWDNNAWITLSFDFTGDPIPVGITDLSLLVVYQGTLGREPDVAVAVGMKDLMEPAHHLYFNLTDRFSLNSLLRTSQEILDNATLLSQVGSAYFYPHDTTIRVGYCKDNNALTPVADVAEAYLAPGKHMKLIILTDDYNNNWIKLQSIPAISLPTSTARLYFNGVANQEYGATWDPKPNPITTFRKDNWGNGIRNHYANGWINCKPQVAEGMCPYLPAGAIIPVPAGYEIPVASTIWY